MYVDCRQTAKQQFKYRTHTYVPTLVLEEEIPKLSLTSKDGREKIYKGLIKRISTVGLQCIDINRELYNSLMISIGFCLRSDLFLFIYR